MTVITLKTILNFIIGHVVLPKIDTIPVNHIMNILKDTKEKLLQIIK